MPLTKHTCAGVAKLVDALDLGSSIARCGGSSPLTRTMDINNDRSIYCPQDNQWGCSVISDAVTR